jgi:hypothetical protein
MRHMRKEQYCFLLTATSVPHAKSKGPMSSCQAPFGCSCGLGLKHDLDLCPHSVGISSWL